MNGFIFRTFFRLLPAKSTKFCKLKKTLFPSGLFLPILRHVRNYLDNSLLSFFLFLDFYCCAKFQEKLIEKSPEKLVTDIQTYRQTDGWIHKHYFIGRHLPRVQNCTVHLHLQIISKFTTLYIICK